MGEKRYESLNVPNEFKLEVFYSLTTAESYKGCILCVPGVCHGAWCFENFLKFFPDNGFDCFALSFRGHAGSLGHENLNKFGLSDYSEDIKECINFCLNEKKVMRSIPFLLGHSMGGAVVQKYIGEYTNTVKGAILFASATAGGMNFCKTMKDGITHKNLFFANIVGLGFGNIIKSDSIWKSAFFDKRISHDKAEIYKEKLCKESRIILFRDLYKKYTNNNDIYIPILVVGSYADSYFKEDSLIATAEAYKCSKNDTKKKLEILSDLCNDMMLDEVDEGWKESAKVVLKFMEDNK